MNIVRKKKRRMNASRGREREKSNVGGKCPIPRKKKKSLRNSARSRSAHTFRLLVCPAGRSCGSSLLFFFFLNLFKMLFRSRDWWIQKAHLAVWSIDNDKTKRTIFCVWLFLESTDGLAVRLLPNSEILVDRRTKTRKVFFCFVLFSFFYSACCLFTILS